MDVVEESKESTLMIMVTGDGGGMPIPQPMAGLHESTPAPFLMKTYDMVENRSTNGVVSWSEGHNSFIVWDCHSFATTVLPRYFKHDNFSSFIRQLNTYGFRKVDPTRWEFAHELFLRGQRQLLKNIKRRQINVQHKRRGKSGTKECDRTALIGEILKLKQQELRSRNHILQMERRLRENEKKVEQITSFLEKTLQPKSQHPPPDNNIEEEDAGQVQGVGFDLEAVLTAAIDNDLGNGRLIDNQAKEEMKRIENTLEGLIAGDDGIIPQGQNDGFYDIDSHLNDSEDGFGTKMPDWNDYMDYV